MSQPIYVYELPVRLWHSLNALLLVVLIATGDLIADPLASVTGEASDHFVMGYIRKILLLLRFPICLKLRKTFQFCQGSFHRKL